MSLTLLSFPLSSLSLSPSKPHPLFGTSHCIFSFSTNSLRSYCTNKDKLTSEKLFKFIDDDLLRKISGAKSADQVLEVITESKGSDKASKMETQDCNLIIEAAFESGNVDLALSFFDAMQFKESRMDGKTIINTWRWSRPDLNTYAIVVKGLAASLRVSEAIKVIGHVSRMGVSSGEEVLFGKTIQCPTCKIAISVAQPQHGSQAVSCSKCRYQYELVSGDIISITSEEISKDTSSWDKALVFLKLKTAEFPSAIHSIVVRTPSGTAYTHRFATKTPNVPAQHGERVTISLSAPPNSFRELGPLKLGPRPVKFRPAEPMCITNHITGQVSDLLRPPDLTNGSGLLNPYPFGILGAASLLASGDALSGFVDLELVRIVLGSFVVSTALGTLVNQVALPELRKLPQKAVDLVAFKQQLLSQYDMVQNRIKDLKQAAEKEVWMLARMSQLENKIIAVGEPSYRARRGRVKKVRENLERALLARIKLIESYAKISSMIEIEVEMDSDVLAAEATNNAERISEQIQQIMEIDNLEEQWRIQAEANDEVERLLNEPS